MANKRTPLSPYAVTPEQAADFEKPQSLAKNWRYKPTAADKAAAQAPSTIIEADDAGLQRTLARGETTRGK